MTSHEVRFEHTVLLREDTRYSSLNGCNTLSVTGKAVGSDPLTEYLGHIESASPISYANVRVRSVIPWVQWSTASIR